MNVLIDNNVSPRIARALNALFTPEHQITALRDRFAPEMPDKDWILALSGAGRWIVISGDRRITKNKAEYHAFRNSRLVGFFLAPALYKAKVIKQAERILALWDRIETLSATVEGGAMFELQIKSNLVRQLRT